MSKIYQKMYLKNKSRAKGNLGGLANNVILRNFYSESQPLSIRRAGFTLIELLVVVLIIGILAAVALPQYNAAVWKSRYAHLMTSVDAIKKSVDLYYMATGRYPFNFEGLAITLPCTISESKRNCYFEKYYCTLNDGTADENGNLLPVIYCIYGEPYLAYGWSVSRRRGYCMAEENSDLANRVCQSMGGEYYGSANGHKNYHL